MRHRRWLGPVATAALGFLLLVNLKLEAYEAAILFVFWLTQFLFPSTREAMIWVYAAWCGIEILRIVAGGRTPLAVSAAWRVVRERGSIPAGVE